MPATLRSARTREQFLVSLTIGYAINRVSDSGYAVNIEAYAYDILDNDGREILAHHWHPSGISRVRRAHLHLSSKLPALEVGQGAAPLRLSDMHVNTGHVALEDVAESLIGEFGVCPLTRGWQAILDHGRDGTGQATG